MALYNDAASILQTTSSKGSFKSRIYGAPGLRSQPSHVYALITETSICDTFLAEVIENAELLVHEPKLTPILALFLVHDLLFTKSGIAAAAGHPLRRSIERHKARLKAEATKLRIRHKCADLAALKELLVGSKGTVRRERPRWARVNTLKIDGDFKGTVNLPQDLSRLNPTRDDHIPDLYGFSHDEQLQMTDTYRKGQIILQDKASCFPAYLLLGDDSIQQCGDVIDACAAPGNKTTHAAALLKSSSQSRRIFACERDPKRSEILQTMVQRAGAQVDILKRQDFLALDQTNARFANVTHLLLDPSCSGSGIIGREDVPTLKLPVKPGSIVKRAAQSAQASGRKRKHQAIEQSEDSKAAQSQVSSLQDSQPEDTDEQTPLPVDEERLHKLGNLQSKIIEHAMEFPAAEKITYSTCSVHQEENEEVVLRVLRSEVAKRRGWKLYLREDQPDGLRRWKCRGTWTNKRATSDASLSDAELEACIRCYPDDEEGTMGFFVCGFVRHPGPENGHKSRSSTSDDNNAQQTRENDTRKDDEWAGFSD